MEALIALGIFAAAIFLVAAVLKFIDELLDHRRRERLLDHEWTEDEWNDLPEAPALKLVDYPPEWPTGRPFDQEKD